MVVGRHSRSCKVFRSTGFEDKGNSKVEEEDSLAGDPGLRQPGVVSCFGQSWDGIGMFASWLREPKRLRAVVARLTNP